MGSLRLTDIQTCATEVLDLTSLTVEEFQRLVPPFEGTFQAHMVYWRPDGQPRTARRYTTYQNCPLPTLADRLLFILVYLKTDPLQVVQGPLFGMGQSKAHQWIHVLLTVLQATLRALGDAPTWSVTELATRLGVAGALATAIVVPTDGAPMPSDPPASTPTSPLFGHDGTERRIERRRVRIEHVNSSLKRFRIVHDTSRLRKAGVRDRVMEVCCALHNFRVRLSPWQPMV